MLIFKNKKSLTVIIFIIISNFFLSSCSKNSSGGYTWGVGGSPAFYATATDEEINDYENKNIYKYVEMEVYEICSEWDTRYALSRRDRMNRDWMSKALVIKGEDPMACRNSGLDASRRAEDRAIEAERKAKKAEAAARAADRRARQLEQEERNRKFNEFLNE